MSRSGSSRWARGAGARLAVFAATLIAVPAIAVEVTRGPYLQRVSTNHAVVRWRTDVATTSWVGWGPSPGQYPGHSAIGIETTEHRVDVAGLPVNATMYYAVGDDGGILAGGDEAHRIRTARAAGDWRPTRIWVLGDSGRANADAESVRDGYFLFANDVQPDLWLMLGDNAYFSGTDPEYQAAVFDMYPETLRASSLWPALGNHDAVSSDSLTLTGPYFDSFSLPRNGQAGGLPSQSEAWYSFEDGQIHFVTLDSADSSLAPGSPMLAWLAADLAANRRPWTVVYFHHPPYTKGSHDSDDPADSEGRMTLVRENVLPILEAHGVELVLAGHSHGYERSFLLDGHYGDSTTFLPEMRLDAGDGDPDGDGPYSKGHGPHGGTVYVVAGSSGAITGTIEPHPAFAVGLLELGSVVLDVDRDRLDVRFVRTDGSVGDHVQIRDAGWLFCDGFESGNASEWTGSGL